MEQPVRLCKWPLRRPGHRVGTVLQRSRARCRVCTGASPRRGIAALMQSRAGGGGRAANASPARPQSLSPRQHRLPSRGRTQDRFKCVNQLRTFSSHFSSLRMGSTWADQQQDTGPVSGGSPAPALLVSARCLVLSAAICPCVRPGQRTQSGPLCEHLRLTPAVCQACQLCVRPGQSW